MILITGPFSYLLIQAAGDAGMMIQMRVSKWMTEVWMMLMRRDGLSILEEGESLEAAAGGLHSCKTKKT